MIRIPEISSIETAIRLYWEKIELSTKDIKELFHPVGNKKVVMLKETAKEKNGRKSNTVMECVKSQH